MYTLVSRHNLHQRARHRSRLRILYFIITLGIAAVWWFTLAPSAIGGPLTYAIVSGESMKPDLQDGDLIVAREQQNYVTGDPIVYEIYGGYVVHEIISQNSLGFRTQGTNNPYPDSWVVPKENVLGKELAIFPGVGNSLVYLRTNPLALGVVAAVLSALLLIEVRPRKKSERLKELLVAAKREIPNRTWPVATWIADGLLLLLVTSLVATSLMLARGVDFYPRVAMALAATVLATIGFEWISSWINNGKSLSEPYRSIQTFGARLYQIDSSTEIKGESQLVKSPKELLRLSDAARFPLIHMMRNDGKLHEFWLITDDLNYFWRVSV